MVDKCGAVYNPELSTSTEVDTLNWTLCSRDFRLLCIVAAEDSDYPAENGITRTVESTVGDRSATGVRSTESEEEVRGGAVTAGGEEAITLVESASMQCLRLLQEMRSAGNFAQYKEKIVVVVRANSGLDQAREDDCWTLVSARNGETAEKTAQRVLEGVQDDHNVRCASTPVRNGDLGSTENLVEFQEHKIESGHSKTKFKGSTEHELETKKHVRSVPISRRKRMKEKKAAKSDKDLSDLKESKRTKSDKDLSDSKEAKELIKGLDQKMDSLLASTHETSRQLKDIQDAQEFQSE